jgi:putative sterol carrier protein
MGIKFPSDEWAKMMMEDLNKSDAYMEAAKNWEGDFYFIIEPREKSEQSAILYMDLWHGKCREAFVVTDPDIRKPVFRLSGSIENWKKVMTKQIDPMQAMMTGKLKLHGNMAMVMKNVRAAKELVESCTRIDTDYPI